MMFALVPGPSAAPFVFLLVLNLFLLIVGCMMDIFSAMIVVVPLITPLASALSASIPSTSASSFLPIWRLGLNPSRGASILSSSLRFRKTVIKSFSPRFLPIPAPTLPLTIITYVPSAEPRPGVGIRKRFEFSPIASPKTFLPNPESRFTMKIVPKTLLPGSNQWIDRKNSHPGNPLWTRPWCDPITIEQSRRRWLPGRTSHAFPDVVAPATIHAQPQFRPPFWYPRIHRYYVNYRFKESNAKALG